MVQRDVEVTGVPLGPLFGAMLAWVLGCGSMVVIEEGAAPLEPGSGGGQSQEEPPSTPICPDAIPVDEMTPVPAPIVLATDPYPWRMRDVALDADYLYWTAADQDTWDGKISAVSKNGGTAWVLADQQANPGFLAVDESHVYWTNNSSINGAVMRVRKDGTDLQTLAWSSAPFSIAIDEEAVYWTDLQDDSVYVIEKEGGTTQTLASGLDAPQGLALNEEHVYWADYGSGRVLRVHKAGGPVETVAAGQVQVRGVAVDCHALYWSTQQVTSAALFKLELPLGSGEPEPLANAPVNSRLVVDALFVYGEQSMKVPREGGEPIPLTGSPVVGEGVAVDEAFFYTAEDGAGLLHKIPK